MAEQAQGWAVAKVTEQVAADVVAAVKASGEVPTADRAAGR